MFINFSTRNLDACIHIHNIIYVYMLSRARNLKSPWANHATLFSHLKASGLEARDGFISFFICFFLFFALYTWTIFHFCFFFCFHVSIRFAHRVYLCIKERTPAKKDHDLCDPRQCPSLMSRISVSLSTTLYIHMHDMYIRQKKKKE